MCTIIVVQILWYKYYYMQHNELFSQVKNFVLKVKTNMKERCSIDQKETVKEKII